jgi:hypothetical protein
MAFGARAHVRRARSVARPLACALFLAALVAGTLGPRPELATAAAAPNPTVPAVRLIDQSPFVRAPGGVLAIDLTRTGPLAFHDATVQLTVFDRLTTRFGLESAISSPGPVGAVSTTPALAARCLPGSATLRVLVDVAQDGADVGAPAQCAGHAPVLRLGCQVACDGVYPLQITARGGGTVTTIDTLVTFARSTKTPLHVVWVLRIAGATHGFGDAAGALRAVGAHPGVALTIDAQGAAIAKGLAAKDGPTWRSLLRAATAGRVHELIGESYAPASLGTLRASRLFSEVIGQFALTDADLATGVGVAPTTTVTYGSGPQTPTSASAVAAIGIRGLIEPGAALAEDPSDSLTWGSPFTLAGVASGPTVLASDTGLSELSGQTGADPGLTAAQFLGELSFLHFEQPDLDQPRVATVVTTLTNGVTRSFVDGVLLGLAHNPVLAAVTASNALSTVPVGANGFPAVRALAAGPSRRWPKKLVDFIVFLRATTNALGTAIISGASPIPRIDGALLSAERVQPEAARVSQLDKVHRDLELEVGHFRIYAGPITLTGTGSTSIPITVFSTAPYAVHGFLELSSPRIEFPQGATMPFTLTGTVHSVRVPARALVTGDLPLTVRFVSPNGLIVLAHASITVRATGFSAVGIALTVLAALVLAVWWVRTARRRRAARS